MVIDKSFKYIILSVFFNSLMYALIKLLNDYSVFQIVFFRATVALIFTIPLILINKIKILGNNRKLLLIRGVLGVTSMIFFFQSIKYLDLGVSVSVRYTSPIFATIFAMFFLKEKVNIFQWGFLLISFIGVVIIKLDDIEISLMGLSYAIISAVSLGLAFVVTNKIGKKESPLVILNYFMMIAFLFSAIMSINNWVSPSYLELIILLSMGVFGYFGLLYLTKAFQSNMVNNIVPVKYLEVVFSLIIGISFFNETYTIYSILGILLILIGVILNNSIINNDKNKY